jgi:glutamyl-tRNA reductase
LTATVERHLRVRSAESETAEAIVEEEIQGFAVWLGSLEVLPTIAALREHGERIVDEVLAANENRWETLSEADRARVEAVARAVANRLLHEPTNRVKQAGERRHARMQVLRELFGLEEPAHEAATDDAAPAEVRELPRRRTG